MPKVPAKAVPKVPAKVATKAVPKVPAKVATKAVPIPKVVPKVVPMGPNLRCTGE